jgi:DNA polymerase-3 subunit alpha
MTKSLNFQDAFVHLRVHTAYSLSEGALKVEDVVPRAQELGMPALAITDTDNMFGALEFALACAKAGIQPLIGIEVKLKDPLFGASSFSCPSFVLIAQSEVGYKNLIQLISRAYIDLPNRGTPHVVLKDLQGTMEGIIALSGGAEGPLGNLILHSKLTETEVLLTQFLELFGDRFYMEISRHGMESEARTEDVFLKLAYDRHIPLVATNNCFFKDPVMYEAHDALICIAEGAYVAEPNRRKVTPHHYFKSSQEMKELFRDLPEAIENTTLIAQRCHYMPTVSPPLLPPFKSESGRDEVEELKAQAAEGLAHRLEKYVFNATHSNAEKENIETTYKERLKYELNVIIQMGFAGYFLIVADFIQWAKRHHIPVGPGRGSGAGSLVAWSLTITDMDPIRFNLLFERFLNPERISLPDFDVDFCQDRRDEVIHYVQQRYGSEKVAQIITFGKLQARAVLRDVGRVLQMPYPQVDRICKLVPQTPGKQYTLEEAINQEPLLQEMRINDASVAHLMDIALKLEGLYRHASTHAAGIIIGDRPLNELVPLYRDPKSDILATQFSMKYVELAGLIKFDFLGLKTLTILENAAEIAQAQGTDIQIDTIPLDDQKTFDLLKRVETVGIFQLEGQGMRDVVRKLKPDRFEEIIALVALYRPGPMDDIPRYLACKHGEEKVSYLHPKLEPILEDTYGVMVYQEQVMQIAQELGGYTLGAADLLRRAMGKKIKSEMDQQRKIFQEGAIKNNVSPKIASKIFDQMAKFAGYGFNKSHSAPYALISYQTAYMKANFPHEFMAATMTYDMNNTDKLDFYRQDLKALGITLLLPDINKSEECFTVEIDLITGEKAVRYALSAIRNVGEQSMKDMVDERKKNGSYKDLNDFLSRVTSKILNKRQMESLISAGAFDSLHKNRAQLFEAIESMIRHVGNLSDQRSSQQVDLFGTTKSSNVFELPDVGEWPLLQKLKQESEAIGFYLSCHPLESYGEEALKKWRVTSSHELEKISSTQTNVIGIPTLFKPRVTKTGKKFAFLGLSDAFGSYEVTVFSELIDQARTLVEKAEPLFIGISMRRDSEGTLRLTANNLKSLSQVAEKVEGPLRLQINALDILEKLKVFLSAKPQGSQEIFLLWETEKGERVEIELPDRYKLTAGDLETLMSYSLIREAPNL